MKTAIATIFAFLQIVFAAHAQQSFTAHGSTVIYAAPDSSQWNLVNDGIHPKSGGYLLMFEHKPIADAQGRPIKPVIAVICEPVKDSSDVIKYSIAKRLQVPFEVKKMLIPQRGDFTYKNAVGFEGQYDKGVIHKVLIGHMRHKEVGLQIICDSTDGVYDKVDSDMRNFLKSVNFKE